MVRWRASIAGWKAAKAAERAAELADEADQKRRELAAAMAAALVAEDPRGGLEAAVTVGLNRAGDGGLGIVVGEDCVVLGLERGGAAAAAGVVPQSRILSVAGTAVSDRAELLRCLKASGERVVLELEPPVPPLATVRLDPAATSVLEPLPGQFHFRAAAPGEGGRWAVLAVALPEGDVGGHEAVRQLLRPVLGERFVSCFGSAAAESAAATVAAEQTVAASVRRGFLNLKNIADLVGSTVNAAAAAAQASQPHAGPSDGMGDRPGMGVRAIGRGLNSALSVAAAAKATAEKVRDEQATDPLRRQLPADWYALPVVSSHQKTSRPWTALFCVPFVMTTVLPANLSVV